MARRLEQSAGGHSKLSNQKLNLPAHNSEITRGSKTHIFLHWIPSTRRRWLDFGLRCLASKCASLFLCTLLIQLLCCHMRSVLCIVSGRWVCCQLRTVLCILSDKKKQNALKSRSPHLAALIYPSLPRMPVHPTPNGLSTHTPSRPRPPAATNPSNSPHPQRKADSPQPIPQLTPSKPLPRDRHHPDPSSHSSPPNRAATTPGLP